MEDLRINVRDNEEQGNGIHHALYMDLLLTVKRVWSWFWDRKSDDGNVTIIVFVSSKSPLYIFSY